MINSLITLVFIIERATQEKTIFNREARSLFAPEGNIRVLRPFVRYIYTCPKDSRRIQIPQNASFLLDFGFYASIKPL